MSKVSVIITSYNNPILLKRAIESVLNQTFKDYELIIADDNSSDKKVLEVISAYAANENVKFFNSNILEEDRLKTARYATQINTAVKKYAKGKYLLYLADDDFYYPQMIEKMVHFAEKNSYDVVYCKQDFVDVNGNVRDFRFPNRVLDCGMDCVDHNQVMTSRESYDKVNGWEDDPACWGGADGYFWQKLNSAGYLFYPIDTEEALQAKTYRENSVQWRISQGLSPIV